MQNAELNESQGEIKNSRRNINNLRYWHIYIYLRYSTTVMAENEEELKSLLMRVKEESEKGPLKLNIQKPKIIASSSITFMENRREKNGSSDRFYFLGLQNHCRL